MTERNLMRFSNFLPTLRFASKDQRNKGKYLEGWLNDEGKTIQKGTQTFYIYRFLVDQTDLAEAEMSRRDQTGQTVNEPFPVIKDGKQEYSLFAPSKLNGLLQYGIKRGMLGAWCRIEYWGMVPSKNGMMHNFDVQWDLNSIGQVEGPRPPASLPAPASEVEEPLPPFEEEA